MGMNLTELFHELCARHGQKCVAAWAEMDISKVSRTKNGEIGLTNRQWDRLLKKAGVELIHSMELMRYQEVCLVTMDWLKEERRKRLEGYVKDREGD